MKTSTRNLVESSRSQPRGPASTALPAGTPAPDFALRSTPDQTVKLSEFRGRPVVLAFYPADWSPVCGDQMGLYTHTARVRQDVRSGARQGVNGTPCFFINGMRYDGAPGVEDLLAALTAEPG